MDVQRLIYFTSVAEAGSFSAAAHRTNVSQPSLSRQISLLEDELGVKLFSRLRRGVVLTTAGEALFVGINRPLDEIDRALKDTRSARQGRRSSIVLWLPPTVESLLASPLTRRFATCAPDISLRITGGSTGSIANLIRQRELDIGILYGPRAAWEDMDWWSLLRGATEHPLIEEQIVLVGAPSDNPSPGEAVSVEALAGLPLVLPSQANLPALLRRLLAEIEAGPHRMTGEVRESDSLHQTKQIAMSGAGYAPMPLSSVLVELREGTLAYAPIASPLATRELILVARGDSLFPDIQARTIALVKDEIRDLVASGGWPAKLLF